MNMVLFSVGYLHLELIFITKFRRESGFHKWRWGVQESPAPWVPTGGKKLGHFSVFRSPISALATVGLADKSFNGKFSAKLDFPVWFITLP